MQKKQANESPSGEKQTVTTIQQTGPVPAALVVDAVPSDPESLVEDASGDTFEGVSQGSTEGVAESAQPIPNAFSSPVEAGRVPDALEVGDIQALAGVWPTSSASSTRPVPGAGAGGTTPSQAVAASHMPKAGEHAVLPDAGQSGAGPQAPPGEHNIAPGEVDFLPPLIQSLSTLFRLTGKRVSGTHLLAALGNNPPSPASCRRAAKSLGMELRMLHRANLEDISPVVLPCMLLLSRNRSAVLEAFDGENVRVVLPEYGHESTAIPLASLSEEYTGYALFVTPDPEEDPQKASSIPELSRWFWDVVLHYKPMFRQVLIVSIVINMLALMGPLFFMNVYDRVVPNLAVDTLWVLGVGIIVGYVFECILRILRDTFTNNAGRNIDVVLGTRLMKHVLGIRMEDRPSSSGELLNNLREAETLREFFSASSILALVDLPFLLLFLFIVLMLGGVLVLVPLVAVFVLLVWVWLMQTAVKAQAARMHRSNVEKNAHMVEIVSGMEAIKMASAQSRMLHIWETVVGRSAANAATAKRITTTAVSSALLITHLVSVVTIIWGVYLIGENKLTTGGLIACNMLVGRAMSFVVQLATLMTRMQQARTAFRVLNELMALPPEDEHAPNVEFGHLPHSLELEEVMFTYRGANLPTLSNLNLVIKPGEKVGVMGNMGSGKSTFLRLLAGLYQPSAGSVKFGGVDLRQLDLVELRTRMGFLPQEPLLFQGTVRDNIALGTPHVPDQLILRAAWISGVADFVRRHPAGYGLMAGERGQNLSGGQRQAVAMARALLHDPDILLLDEPTSNIDGLTEMYIRQRLKRVLGNKTLVVSMHRTSLLDLVDRLIVFRQGRIIADGPKQEVLKQLNSKDAERGAQGQGTTHATV